MTLVDVAAAFKSSFLFLSFGYPEGFGLPVAEALCCGCKVVGYSGLGGKELFRIGSLYSCAYDVDFLDFSSFLDSIIVALDSYPSQHSFNSYSDQRLCSANISSTYSSARYRATVDSLVPQILSALTVN